jgi:hypothetical protein
MLFIGSIKEILRIQKQRRLFFHHTFWPQCKLEGPCNIQMSKTSQMLMDVVVVYNKINNVFMKLMLKTSQSYILYY